MRAIKKGIIMVSIGKRIRYYRTQRGWTQSELGEKVNIDHRQISLYELGKSVPAADIILLFARIFGVTPNDLFGLDEGKEDVFDGLSQAEKLFILDFIDFMRARSEKHR